MGLFEIDHAVVWSYVREHGLNRIRRIKAFDMVTSIDRIYIETANRNQNKLKEKGGEDPIDGLNRIRSQQEDARQRESKSIGGS